MIIPKLVAEVLAHGGLPLHAGVRSLHIARHNHRVRCRGRGLVNYFTWLEPLLGVGDRGADQGVCEVGHAERGVADRLTSFLAQLSGLLELLSTFQGENLLTLERC